MHLESIELRDWKAFEDTRFDFPAPTKNKNVVLIGGRNGFGKTSVFEALVLGLFGRDGLGLVQRAGAASDEQRRAQTYRDFMERALFAGALAEGRLSCRVALRFSDEDLEPIWVERTWYFTSRGALRQGESAEQLQIFQGSERRIVSPPRGEDDFDGWYRDWISRTFLPTSLAGFFLYDGEAAAIYAERDMAHQVRGGIEGLLGLNWLRRLEKDLRDYAHSRRAQTARGADAGTVALLDQAVALLEGEVDVAEQRLARIEVELAETDIHLDRLTRALGYGAQTRESSETVVRERAMLDMAFSGAQRLLTDAAQRELPFLVAGGDLLDRVAERLRAEARSRQQQQLSADRQAAIDRVRKKTQDLFERVDPPLSAKQQREITEAFEAALAGLWPVGDQGNIGPVRHDYASVENLLRTGDALHGFAQSSWDGALAAVLEMRVAAKGALQVERELGSQRLDAPDFAQVQTDLSHVVSQQGQLREERAVLRNSYESRSAELNQKRRELSRLAARFGAADRPAQLTLRAEAVAEMLVGLLEEAWPTQAASLALAMSAAMRSMTHRKEYLHNIVIEDDGTVQLLSPRGRDLRQLDLSAGEKQIFTQALFSAVGEISGREFPMVIDTPLGRLDDAHRSNVLKHLAKRNGQIFLISTDTEVVDRYLDVVRSRVCACYIIENEVRNGVAVSKAKEGYFEGQGFQ